MIENRNFNVGCERETSFKILFDVILCHMVVSALGSTNPAQIARSWFSFEAVKHMAKPLHHKGNPDIS